MLNSSIISKISVPDGLPDTFADGAAIGTFDVFRIVFAILLLGILIPTVSNPADTLLGIISFFLG